MTKFAFFVIWQKINLFLLAHVLGVVLLFCYAVLRYAVAGDNSTISLTLLNISFAQ
jgi:hypothetical protein